MPTDLGGDKPRCEFIKVRGYWKGWRCCNNAKLELGGKHYCPVHYGIAVQQSRTTETGEK